MKEKKIIQSFSNPAFKFAKKAYTDKKFRMTQGLFACEGYKEITRALENNYKVLKVYTKKNSTKGFGEILSKLENINYDFDYFELESNVLKKLSLKNKNLESLILFERKKRKKILEKYLKTLLFFSLLVKLLKNLET